LKTIGEELVSEAVVGEANMSVTLGLEVNWFDGISKLLLECVVNVSIFTPLAEELCVLTDSLAQLRPASSAFDY
jgi:hypothetical protein